MAALTPSTAPLSQALSRRRASPLPAILMALGLIASVAFAILGYLESRKTETLVIFTRPVPYGQQISAEDVATVELPLHRPAQLAGVASPAAVVGQYAARDLGANDLAQPAMLLAEPPTQPVYPNGQALTPNMVPVPFSTATIGPISFRDRVNLGFNDPSGDPALCDQALSAAAGERPSLSMAAPSPAQPRPFACRLLSYVRVLYVDEGRGVAYLELTPYQSQTIWALQAAGLALWGERYGVDSDSLPALERLDIGQVNAEELSAPAPAPRPRDPAALPGAGSQIPGAPYNGEQSP